MTDETNTPQPEQTPKHNGFDLNFTSGQDGCTIHEVVLRFRALDGNKLQGVTFRPREGIVGIQGDLDHPIVDTVVLSFGADETFPGLVFEANADMLLNLKDDDWRNTMVEMAKRRYLAEQPAIAAERLNPVTQAEMAEKDGASKG